MSNASPSGLGGGSSPGSGGGPGGDAPKIIIDTDWKSQAQAEKEKLVAAESAKKAQQQAKTDAGPAGAPREEGPIGIQDLISLLVSQTLMYLGAVPDPQSGRAIVAPEYAKLHIDMLSALEEKTKGNLSESESKLLGRALHELRMEYVEVSNYVNKAIAEGKIKPGTPGIGGGAPSGIVGAAGNVPLPP
ncbi:MAG: DUF1844 domain-containing protein [Phycisphaeraceae bacterium]|nr:DUF1844 domain-containing protein [Phycisphaeraceae bacterium]